MAAVPDPIARLVDDQPIDWQAATASEAALLDALHTLEQVRNAYRRIGSAPAAPTTPLFQWGPLSVHAKIGSGASAEVYRAWDSGLATDVALKLLRPEAAAAGLRSSEFLHEGRVLARLSQRNVVRVYGAAVHDGRPGIWAEWIEGRTLDAIVENEGAFAGMEAAHIGLELCAALAAIHGAGLVHGDVKASNVLRARGGRIVLVDLGAAGTPAALGQALRTQATPSYLSPQARAGAPRSADDDLYALGVLLHYLVTARHPPVADDAPRPRAPELPAALAAVIERALAPQPAQRYRDADAFAHALRSALAGPAAAAPRRRHRRWLGAAAAVALALAAAAWWSTRAPTAWSPQASLVRHTDHDRPLRDGERLQLGDRIDLKLVSDRPTWAWVLNEDEAGSFHLLFPLPGLPQSNPLPTGALVLPGRQQGRALSWQVSSAAGREEFVVVLADRPLPALEQRVASLAAARIEPIERGVDRVASVPLAQVSLRGRHLNALLADSAADLADTHHVRVLGYRFETTR
ncbi:MAG: DUF4384 domain-containing protein [Xanthomonadales bacterium]|nr:DUF4384 domain-containing protein [Xanthomonadales bacterium]MDL1870162.1 DUF4384 domain-containing protein [Gammaproteobacteria bacterium PRO6]